MASRGEWSSVSIHHQHVCFYISTTLFCYYGSSVQFEIRDSDTSSGSFIIQDCFSFLGFSCVCFYMKLNFFNFYEELCWNFDKDCVESVDYFWKVDVFTILILPIHELGDLSTSYCLLQILSSVS